MHKLSVPLFFLFIILFYSKTQAQEKLDNTLLWRISGNGLKEPSYLYGTIHINDKRVFQLGDSVHAAIAATKGLAAELDMFSFTNEMIAGIIEDYTEDEPPASKAIIKKEVLVKNELNKSQWDNYKKALEKLLKIKADKITVTDLERYKKYQKDKMYRGGEMSTVLDAWLLTFAKKTGKWVGGIEDFGDQEEYISTKPMRVEELVEDVIYGGKYYDSQLSWMIDQYLNARLDSVDKMYNSLHNEKDEIMIKRNKKMAYRMDSLSAVRSTFFAIGMAHLPGEEGVINLLREKGFIVSPVFSVAKINSESIKPVHPESYWLENNFADNKYRLKMPGNPIKINKGIGAVIDMYMHFDLAEMKAYMTIQTPIHGEKRGEAIKRIMRDMNKSAKGVNKLKSTKELVILGMPGIEYVMETKGWEMKAQVIEVAEKMVVINGVMALNANDFNKDEVNYYFNSFAFDEQKMKAMSSEADWTVLKNERLSFSVNMLQSAKSGFNANIGDMRTEHTWSSFDTKNEIFYGMNALILKEGYYHAEQDTSYLLGIKDNLKTSFKNATVADSVFSTTEGNLTFSTTLLGDAKDDFYKIKCKLVLRGGILYYLFTTYAPNSRNDIMSDHYLSSFTLLPYKQEKWAHVKSPDGSFSLMVPDRLKTRDAEWEKMNNYERGVNELYTVYDSIAGYSVNIDKTIIPDWYWVPSDSVFLRNRSSFYVGWNDSLVNYSEAVVGNIRQASFTVAKEGTNIVKKVKLLLNGSELYEMYGFVSAIDTANNLVDYYKHFKIEKEQKRIDGSVAKINMLKQWLEKISNDEMPTTISWIKNIDFSVKDLPDLQELALKAYPDIDSSYYSGLNKHFFDIINNLDTSMTMVGVIEKNYDKLKGRDEILKPYFLDYLSGIKTAAAYQVLKKLLVSGNHYFVDENIVYLSVYDSLELTRALYPDVLVSLDRPNLWPVLISPLRQLLEKELIKVKDIQSFRGKIMALAKDVLATEKEYMEESPYRYIDIITVLSYFNDAEANNLIAQFLQVENIPLRFAAVKALLKNKQPVSEDILIFLAKDDYYRYDLYVFMEEQKVQHLFPMAYNDRKGLAKSKLYTFLVDEEEVTPDNIVFMEEKVSKFKNREHRFLLFKVVFVEEDDDGNTRQVEYVGIVGPYTVKGKELLPQSGATGISWTDTYSKPGLNNLFNKYLSALESSEE